MERDFNNGPVTVTFALEKICCAVSIMTSLQSFMPSDFNFGLRGIG
jgi:hypothetical protein